MTRSLSSGLITQLQNDNNSFAFLLELNLSTVYRITDNAFDVTYNSNSYTASGELISIGTTPETGELKVDEATIRLSNITSTFRTIIEAENYIDNSVNIYLAFFDSNDSFVDAFTYFSGNIQKAEITESKNESALDLIVANHWNNWNLTKGRHFTDESQQNVYSGDKGMEFAHITKSDIRWGS